MWPAENEKDFLQHYGILGMRWGVRRYQNEDGSLTPAGEKRYGSSSSNPFKRANEARLKSAREAISRDIDDFERNKNVGMSEKDRKDTINALKAQRDKYDKKLEEYSMSKSEKKAQRKQDAMDTTTFQKGKSALKGYIAGQVVSAIGQNVSVGIAAMDHPKIAYVMGLSAGVASVATTVGVYRSSRHKYAEQNRAKK